eukprot:1343374-Pleurochrysis_carterae.AAC.3
MQCCGQGVISMHTKPRWDISRCVIVHAYTRDAGVKRETYAKTLQKETGLWMSSAFCVFVLFVMQPSAMTLASFQHA